MCSGITSESAWGKIFSVSDETLIWFCQARSLHPHTKSKQNGINTNAAMIVRTTPLNLSLTAGLCALFWMYCRVTCYYYFKLFKSYNYIEF